mgnify:CR=1 FL=1
MPLIDLSVIIINWNTKEYLSQCLHSFFETNEGITCEVIVIDNASSDGSVEMVTGKFQQVQVIANTVNSGFAGGVNQGISIARGKYILVLNPDIVFKPKTIQSLLQYLDGHKEVGAAMPELINLDGSVQYGYIRRKPSVAQVIFFHTLLTPFCMKNKYLVYKYLESVLNSNSTQEVEQIPGAFTLVRREVIENVGGMDSSFKLFFEDVDWSYRMRQAGWKLMMLHNVQALHIGGRSFVGARNEWMFVRFNLSLIHFIEKHSHWCVAMLVKGILFANSLFVVIVQLVILALYFGKSRKSQLFSYRRHIQFLQTFIRSVIFKQDIPLYAGR